MGRTEQLLRWLYTGRLTFAAAIFIAALRNWMGPEGARLDTLIATVALLGAIAMSAAGIWWVEYRGNAPSRNFLYLQVLFDVALVTAGVHLTGGPTSPFSPLYILVITAAALLLPLPGGMLIGALASLLFFSDVMLHPDRAPQAEDFLRIGLFCVVAVATAAVGERLRRAGTALGSAETELKQLRLETGDILAFLDTALLTVDESGRLVTMNHAAADLLDFTPSDWDGRSVLEALDDAAPGLGAMIARSAETRVPINRREIRRRTRDGERILGARTTVLERGGVPWVTAVFQDITETRQIEELVHRADRLQAVAELGASLAHEIRNPLASIRSGVEQLAGDSVGREDRETLRRLIVGESERLSRLLSDFMEFSRVEQRRFEKIDVGDVARDVIELINHHPDRGDAARIHWQGPRDPVWIDGDRDLIHRALFNLVLNGVQYAGSRGQVTVSVEGLVTDAPSSVQVDAPLRIVVADNGPGVPEEDLSRLFDPFFTTRTGGTGLGLALVHRAVEAHRGAILVDTPPGGGARFTIYLPARTGTELSNAPSAA